ncbi:MAG: heavy-metal-associated domain-containing protein [Gracilibacteraceae bacterium]|jgi:copper chaperone CopZ|nr:heavy-metal-associated domain-containing protein [Gracilibacteraceae bacterium]
MTKTIKIEGMSCSHCQATVERALNAIDGVKAAVDLAAGTATVSLSRAVPDEVLRQAVEEEEFIVLGIA